MIKEYVYILFLIKIVNRQSIYFNIYNGFILNLNFKFLLDTLDFGLSIIDISGFILYLKQNINFSIYILKTVLINDKFSILKITAYKLSK